MPKYPWRSAQLLYELYIKRGLSTHDIADQLDTYANTISEWLRKHDIPTRSVAHGAEELRDESWLRHKYWSEGCSTTDIAAELGCDNTTVGYWMEKHGIDRRPLSSRPDELEDRESLRELYIEQDLSGHDIADKLGCDQKSVYRWINKHDLSKTPKPHRPGEENPQYKDGHRNYGPGWEPLREEIRERDEVCQGCGMTRDKHREMYDADLHVHHIKPAREFDKHDPEMNSEDNLIALCQPCHNKWEGIPLKPVLSD